MVGSYYLILLIPSFPVHTLACLLLRRQKGCVSVPVSVTAPSVPLLLSGAISSLGGGSVFACVGNGVLWSVLWGAICVPLPLEEFIHLSPGGEEGLCIYPLEEMSATLSSGAWGWGTQGLSSLGQWSCVSQVPAPGSSRSWLRRPGDQRPWRRLRALRLPRLWLCRGLQLLGLPQMLNLSRLAPEKTRNPQLLP